ncbi:hypothetical protein FKM82_025772 [Ascaphus truei]
MFHVFPSRDVVKQGPCKNVQLHEVRPPFIQVINIHAVECQSILTELACTFVWQCAKKALHLQPHEARLSSGHQFLFQGYHLYSHVNGARMPFLHGFDGVAEEGQLMVHKPEPGFPDGVLKKSHYCRRDVFLRGKIGFQRREPLQHSVNRRLQRQPSSVAGTQKPLILRIGKLAELAQFFGSNSINMEILADLYDDTLNVDGQTIGSRLYCVVNNARGAAHANHAVARHTFVKLEDDAVFSRPLLPTEVSIGVVGAESDHLSTQVVLFQGVVNFFQ